MWRDERSGGGWQRWQGWEKDEVEWGCGKGLRVRKMRKARRRRKRTRRKRRKEVVGYGGSRRRVVRQVGLLAR